MKNRVISANIAEKLAPSFSPQKVRKAGGNCQNQVEEPWEILKGFKKKQQSIC